MQRRHEQGEHAGLGDLESVPGHVGADQALQLGGVRGGGVTDDADPAGRTVQTQPAGAQGGVEVGERSLEARRGPVESVGERTERGVAQLHHRYLLGLMAPELLDAQLHLCHSLVHGPVQVDAAGARANELREISPRLPEEPIQDGPAGALGEMSAQMYLSALVRVLVPALNRHS